jgi:hypothetical protein
MGGRPLDIFDVLSPEKRVELLQYLPANEAAEAPDTARLRKSAGLGVEVDPIAETLQSAGISELQPGASLAKVEAGVRSLALIIESADEIRRVTIREAVIKKLDEIGINAPGRLVDAAIPKTSHNEPDGTGKTLFLVDPEPWEVPVDGKGLLNEIRDLIVRYIVLSKDLANTVALWILLAWTLDAFDIAPLLEHCIAHEALRKNDAA